VRHPTLIVWAVFCVWALWLAALQGAWATGGSLAAWTPEFGFVLVFALRPELPRGERRAAAALLAAARVAFSSEPVLAVFAAYLGTSGALDALRRSIEIDRPVVRALAAAGATAAAAGFWILCRRISLLEAGIAAPAAALPWRGVIVTGLLVGCALPLVHRLPGARPLVGVRA